MRMKGVYGWVVCSALVMLPRLTVTGQDPAKKTDPPEPFWKEIEKHLKLGGQIRWRGEYRDPVSYAGTLVEKDDDVYITRLRMNIKFSLTEDIDAFLQPQDSHIIDQDYPSLSDDDDIELHQGYVEVRKIAGSAFSVKAGRQDLSCGDQRLVSPLDWHWRGRRWEGVKVRYAAETWWGEAFATVFKHGDLSPADQNFFGGYFSYAVVQDHSLDLYLFHREIRESIFRDERGRTGDVDDTTLGVLFKGKSGRCDYSAEADVQFGKYSTDDTLAYAFAVAAGHTFEADSKPRLGLEYTFASGDEDPDDGDRGTFDPLFPFAHFYQGYLDVFSWKNGHSLTVKGSAQVVEDLVIQLDLHHFWLDSRKDAWYNAGGKSIRRDSTGGSGRDVGTEIDLHAKYNIGTTVKLWGGWSHFFPASYVDETGRDPDMDWFFLQTTFDF